MTITGRQQLGRLWNQDGTLQESHVLINKGPYKYIRHPIYLGESLMAIGTGLFLKDYLILLIFGFGVYLYNGYRVLNEETYLSTHLVGYKKYCKEVPKGYLISPSLLKYYWSHQN